MALIAGTALLLGACGSGGSGTAAGGQTASPQRSTATQTARSEKAAVRSPTTAPGNTDAADAGPPGQDLPRLTEISVSHGNTYSTVTLRFEPDRGTPTASVEEVDDPTLTKPGSGKKVTLDGDQALDVSVSPAIGGSVTPFTGKDPTVAEVRVLGFFEGRTNIGIGIKGDGDLAPKVSKPDDNTITISVDIPPHEPGDPGRTRCGDVAFEPASDAGAFNIVAKGVGCDVARSVAAFAEGMVGEPYGTPSGFSCLPEQTETEPTREIIYACTRDEATITFDT